MNSAESHYLNCMDENCERAYCVGRRDYMAQEIRLKHRIKKLAEELWEARKYDNCICKGQRVCDYHKTFPVSK